MATIQRRRTPFRRTALAQMIQQSIAQSSFVHNNLVLCRPDAIPLPVPPITRMIRHRRSWWRTWTFCVLNDALGFWQIIVTGLERHKAAARSCVLWRQTSNSCSGYRSAGGVYSRQCEHGMRRSTSDRISRANTRAVRRIRRKCNNNTSNRHRELSHIVPTATHVQ